MKKFFRYAGILFAILVLLYLGISYWLLRSTQSRVEAKRQAIIDRGEPLYLTEYETAEIPDEVNAYHYLMSAASDIEAFGAVWRETGVLNYERRLVPEQVQTLAAAVEKYGPMYDLLEQAAACEQYRAELDYSQGLGMEMPHTNCLRNASRAFMAKALVAAYHGEGDEAIEQCVLTLRLAWHLREDPSLVSHFLHLVCQRNTALTANHVLRITEPCKEACRKLEKVLARIDNRRSNLIALKGERATGVLSFQQMRDGTLEDPGGKNDSRFKVFRDVWLVAAYLNDDEAKYLEVFEESLESLNLPRLEREKAQQPHWDELEQSRFRYNFSRLLLPAVGHAADVTDRHEAYIRSLRVLLQIHANSTAQIDTVDLPAEAKIDPFTGRPLIIEFRQGEWKVYSVGGNLLDDGGDIYTPEDNSLPKDLGLGPLLPPLDPADSEDS